MPLAVSRAARLLQILVDADGLDAVPVAEFPLEVVARHEAAESRMERRDVVILEIDLDEGLPVVVALVHFDVIKHEAREVEMTCGTEPDEVCRDIAAFRLEKQALPVLQRRFAEIQARLVREMRCAEQLTVEVIGPAVQRAYDVVRAAAAVEHDGLAVTAHVRQQFDLVLLIAHEHAPFFLARKREIEIVTRLGNHEFMPDVARTLLEKCFDFARQERFVEVCRDRQLAVNSLELLQCIAQIGHSHSLHSR